MPRPPELGSLSVTAVANSQRTVARSTGLPFASRISSIESSGEPSRLAFTSSTSFSPLRALKRKSFFGGQKLAVHGDRRLNGLRAGGGGFDFRLAAQRQLHFVKRLAGGDFGPQDHRLDSSSGDGSPATSILPAPRLYPVERDLLRLAFLHAQRIRRQRQRKLSHLDAIEVPRIAAFLVVRDLDVVGAGLLEAMREILRRAAAFEAVFFDQALVRIVDAHHRLQSGAQHGRAVFEYQLLARTAR